jgi:hypothetical protein
VSKPERQKTHVSLDFDTPSGLPFDKLRTSLNQRFVFLVRKSEIIEVIEPF